MIAERTQRDTRSYEVKPWELNLLVIELILFLGLLGAGGMVIGRRMLGPDVHWPEAAWMGLGFFLIGLALYPALSVLSRNAHGRELPLGKWLVGVVGGTVVGMLISWLMV